MENDDCGKDAFVLLKKKLPGNINRVLIGHINIYSNSVRNKFYMLISMVKDNIDNLMVSERELDSSFFNAKFVTDDP